MANTRNTMGDQETLDAIIADRLTSLEEDGVTKLGNRVFYGKKQLRNVNFPNVRSIGTGAFQNSNIETVSFPEVVEIENAAFNNCVELQECTFPKLILMNGNTFRNCTKLTKIEIGATNGTAFDSGCIDDCGLLNALIIRSTQMSELIDPNEFRQERIGKCGGAIYVPSNLVDTYKSNANWGKYPIASIDDYPLTDFSTIRDTWSQIFAAESNGTYLTKYQIGDTKSLAIGQNIIYMQIVAFNTDTLANTSGKAKITWVGITTNMMHRMNPTIYANIDGTGAGGGWEASEMRTYLKETIKPMLPSEVQNAIVEVKKYSSYVTSSAVRVSNYQTIDDLWIPSAREFLSDANVEQFKESSGPVYYDANNIFRDKYNSSTYNNVDWYTRTAYDLGRFAHFNTSGSISATDVTNARGVILGFCT